MPELCRFLKIIIRIHYDEHPPPHFHAEYQGKRAMFSIATGKKLKGDFPAQQAVLVSAWAVLRKRELTEAWNAVMSEKEPKKIEPLK